TVTPGRAGGARRARRADRRAPRRRPARHLADEHPRVLHDRGGLRKSNRLWRPAWGELRGVVRHVAAGGHEVPGHLLAALWGGHGADGQPAGEGGPAGVARPRAAHAGAAGVRPDPRLAAVGRRHPVYLRAVRHGILLVSSLVTAGANPA